MRILLTLIFLVFVAGSYAQISEPDAATYTLIGKVMDDKLVVHKLERGTRGDSIFYRLNIGLINFRNTGAKYSEKFYDHKALTFRETGGVLDKFYEICRTVFSDENRNDQSYTRSIILGTYNVDIRTDKRLKKPVAFLTFWFTDGSYDQVNLVLSEKELDKLFGR